MRAVIASQAGGPEVLTVTQRPDPQPGPDELLIRVHAAGVNRADVMQREGNYPSPPGASDILGLEIAGEIGALGAGDCRGWAIGDRVCALLAGGGQAEYAVIPAAIALPVPDGLDLVQAAGIVEVFATAYDNIFLRAGLKSGETLLVHGGASGIGTAAIQLARRAGARTVVTAGSQERVDACLALGADAGIVYRDEDFVQRIRELTDGRGADVIADVVGGAYLERNLRALAIEGRLTIIGLLGGATAELSLGRLLARRLTVFGSTLRARDTAAKAVLMGRLRTEVWPGFADGSLRPVIDRVLPMSAVADAHRAMEAGEQIGKIVLQIADADE